MHKFQFICTSVSPTTLSLSNFMTTIAHIRYIYRRRIINEMKWCGSVKIFLENKWNNLTQCQLISFTNYSKIVHLNWLNEIIIWGCALISRIYLCIKIKICSFRKIKIQRENYRFECLCVGRHLMGSIESLREKQKRREQKRIKTANMITRRNKSNRKKFLCYVTLA